MIPFNKPMIAGNELEYIRKAVDSGKISGNGSYTQLCQQYFEQRFHFHKSLLTTSCTAALEMSAILINIQEGDEVIVPSFAFVSTANAFVLRGAKIVFADSSPAHPNIDSNSIESLITPKTKAIIVLHYGGVACEMDKITSLANHYSLHYGHQIFVIEDAAHSIGATYRNKPLGGIGNLSAISFHETKNIQAGEGGMLIINDEQFEKRAEVIWEKGTNRVAFSRNEVAIYDWIDIGSSFLPSEITAAFLFGQLEKFDAINVRRKYLWETYWQLFSKDSNRHLFHTPVIPEYAEHNYHIFYLVCKNKEQRNDLIRFLADMGIMAVFHYQSLHLSPFFKDKHDGRNLPNAEIFSNCLVRLPLYPNLVDAEIVKIYEAIMTFYSDIEK